MKFAKVQLKYSKSQTHSKTVEFDGVKVENINGVDVEIFVEAKGTGYAGMLPAEFAKKYIRENWIEQATRQVEAILENGIAIDLSKHKPLEWHCAEDAAITEFNEALKSAILANGELLSKYIDVIHTVYIP
jgi:hypothetical protein